MTVARYYEIEQEKLLFEFEKITLFTKHNPTLGSYREQVLRDYIRKIVPPQLTVKSGFVARAESTDTIYDSQSRQIDCLIYDNSVFIPLLETEEFAVISPDSMCGCIEVKSKLSFYKKENPNKSLEVSKEFPLGGGYQVSYRWEGTLIDALMNIKCAADESNNKDRAHFSGIFAYDADFKIENVSHAFDNNELQKQLELTHLRQLPQCICVPGKFVIVLTPCNLFDESHLDFESWFHAIFPEGGHIQYPLQYFSVFIHNQINYWLNMKKPDSSGLYTTGSAHIRHLSNHFDLCSEDM